MVCLFLFTANTALYAGWTLQGGQEEVLTSVTDAQLALHTDMCCTVWQQMVRPMRARRSSRVIIGRCVCHCIGMHMHVVSFSVRCRHNPACWLAPRGCQEEALTSATDAQFALQTDVYALVRLHALAEVVLTAYRALSASNSKTMNGSVTLSVPTCLVARCAVATACIMPAAAWFPCEAGIACAWTLILGGQR